MKTNHDYERGLRKAQELGPEKWRKIETAAKDGGYTDVRHFVECTSQESSEYINGLLEGMGIE